MRSLKGPPLLAAIELLEVTSDKSEGGDELFDAVWRVLSSGQALLLQQVLCHCHIAKHLITQIHNMTSVLLTYHGLCPHVT